MQILNPVHAHERTSAPRAFWDLLGVPFRFVLFPDDWNERFGWTSLEQMRIRAALSVAEGRVLDIGAGRNRLIQSWTGDGVGVDVFDFGGSATIVPDTRNLPFDEHTFDTVTFIACLNHIPYRSDALTEAFRLLKPGGRVVATMISRLLGDVGHRIWWYSEDKDAGWPMEKPAASIRLKC